MTLKEKNNEIQKKNQNDLRDLEQFFNTNKVDNMLQKIDMSKIPNYEKINAEFKGLPYDVNNEYSTLSPYPQVI